MTYLEEFPALKYLHLGDFLRFFCLCNRFRKDICIVECFIKSSQVIAVIIERLHHFTISNAIDIISFSSLEDILAVFIFRMLAFDIASHLLSSIA